MPRKPAAKRSQTPARTQRRSEAPVDQIDEAAIAEVVEAAVDEAVNAVVDIAVEEAVEEILAELEAEGGEVAERAKSLRSKRSEEDDEDDKSRSDDDEDGDDKEERKRSAKRSDDDEDPVRSLVRSVLGKRGLSKEATAKRSAGKAQMTALRSVAAKYGLQAEFDDMKTTGASHAELRSFVLNATASRSGTGQTHDGRNRGDTGNELTWANSNRGRRAAERAARR